MYVTDVPVIDRLADLATREIDTASEALETALADLDSWISIPELIEQHEFTPEEICEQLLEAHGRALSAFGHIMDALDLAGLPTL